MIDISVIRYPEIRILLKVQIVIFWFILLLCTALHATTNLKVGVYDNNPTIFMDQSGKPSGLFIELLEDIAQKEDWHLEYIYGQWTEVYEYLQRGEIDILPAIAFSSTREKLFNFTDETVMANWAQLYGQHNSTLGSLLDLQGQKIAVKAGDIHFSALKKLTQDFNFECRFIEVENYETVFEMLDAKYLKYGVVSRIFGDKNKNKYSVQVAPVVFNPIEMRFAEPKNRGREIVAIIDSHILAYKYDQNSIYHQSVKQWLMKETKKEIPLIFWYSLGIASLGTLLFFGLMVLFRYRVRKRTYELTAANTQLASEIIERSKAEESLRSSSERINAFFKSINDAIFVHPLKEKGFGRIIEVNQIACERYGYSREEFLAITVADITQEQDSQIHGKATNRRKLSASRQMIFETVHIKKSGETFPVEINANIVEQDGNNVILAVVRDISERKTLNSERDLLRRQLQQAQKIDAIGRLAGGIAHDFNNMLGVISGNAEIALYKIDSEHPLFANLQEILTASGRSANLTRQLLAFARKQTISPKILDLNNTVAAMLSMLQTMIRENIQLVWKPGGELNPIFIDPGQIDQLLANLCINARDAIAGVGTITIKTQKIGIGDELDENYPGIIPGEYILLSVTDNGCGMNEKTQAKMFDPFFTTKQFGEGTGLGLATVYGIVKQNKGFIYSESELRKGTTFKIFFPKHSEKNKSINEFVKTELKGGKETILVVEDEAPLLEIVERMLVKAGYNVLAANSPNAALETVKKCSENIDLLLTDVIMPEMSGLELSNQLKLVIPELKSLFMSGYTSDTISQHGVLDEGIHFVSKPFSEQELLDAVRNFLDDTEH